jgi:glutathione S-transferase
MAIEVYGDLGSPVCRLVVMVARELNIPINIHFIDVFNNEHLSDEYLKINPHHKVPAIVDGDFIPWESRAIITYFINKYSPGHQLYPADPEIRAKIEAILHFDNGILFQYMEAICFPRYYNRSEYGFTTDETYKNHLRTLDRLLVGKKYLVGDNLTIADLSCMTTLSEAEIVDYDYSPFENISRWYNGLKEELPYYDELNGQPIRETRR